MSNPFRKIADISKDTAKKWESTRDASGVETRTCGQCGAPRPVNTNIAACTYCGFTFMDTEVFIHHGKPPHHDKETGTGKPLG